MNREKKADKAVLRYKSLPTLRDRRIALGFTQQEVLDLINISTKRTYQRTLYVHIESGLRPVDPELAVVISRVLEAPIDQLFTRNE